ncbi:MAG: alpha/beta hydrolase [Pseudomonadota bacterium]
MPAQKFFIHGVPDCPKIWRPLIAELGLAPGDYSAPALPGFETAPPSGFARDKDAYASYLVEKIEAIHRMSGPVDLVGHDWGALLTIRIAGLRPDLVRTWAVSNGAYREGSQGHQAARIWGRKSLGDLVMALTPARRLRSALGQADMPPEMIEIAVDLWKKGHIKKSILGLYQSANGLTWSGPWVETLGALPKRGLVLWGAKDPFGPLALGRAWAAEFGFPFVAIEEAGHWALAERPAAFAPHLLDHWNSADAELGAASN